MAEMFANALAYENLMGRWSARLAPRFVRFAKVVDGGRLLDVGCGTGSLAWALAGAAPRSEIVGIDPAEAFIEYVRTRFTEARIRFDRGDAMALPYPAASFAQALSLLVLQFVPKPEQAASEMRRVTVPGGTVAACTWDRDRLEMGTRFWAEAIKLDPGAESWKQRQQYLSRSGELTALWQAAGLEEIEETGIEIDMDYVSFDDYWGPIAAGVGPLGAYFIEQQPRRQDELRDALRARFQTGGRDAPFTLRARALAVRGMVPAP
jgi:SAM-dependent methyltransferase